ncbi:MAG: sel1 repeat family protein [Acidobacteria bacterium]|nr:sel1 repeat family protein [Acidobacteriota bacterium]
MGHHPAEAMLGIMSVTGRGVAQDNVEGGKWLARAADAGDRLAATNAWMIYNGSPCVRTPRSRNGS